MHKKRMSEFDRSLIPPSSSSTTHQLLENAYVENLICHQHPPHLLVRVEIFLATDSVVYAFFRIKFFHYHN